MKILDSYSFRFAEEILNSSSSLNSLWQEILESIYSITDEEIKLRHEEIKQRENTKSLSKSINQLLDSRLRSKGWQDQSGIFGTPEFLDDDERTWTLDFSKSTSLHDGRMSGIAIEVAFNHAEAAAWNLTKPMLAAEINDVRVQNHIGEGVGVVIVASSELKRNGAFDGAVGDFRRYEKTLKAMRSTLTVPIMLLGLAAPKTFRVQAREQRNSPYQTGEIVPLTS